MKKVLNVEPYGYSKKAISLWDQRGYKYVTSSWDEVSEKQTWADVEVLIIRLSRKIDYDELEFFPNLKIIVSATTGHDHINMEALKEKGIELISLRNKTDFLKEIPSTAEFTWALIQAITRKIPMAYKDVLAGNWDRDSFRGYQLRNKTIGIIGLGRVGKKIAGYAQAFDMNVIYCDPYVEDNSLVKVDDLDKLLGLADIISIHVHLNSQTYHLLNATNIPKIKPGGYVINTSRANIWDEEVIVNHLKKGQISGVATDVLCTELGDIRQSPLWKAAIISENILITPHLGGATWDAMWACEEFIASDL